MISIKCHSAKHLVSSLCRPSSLIFHLLSCPSTAPSLHLSAKAKGLQSPLISKPDPRHEQTNEQRGGCVYTERRGSESGQRGDRTWRDWNANEEAGRQTGGRPRLLFHDYQSEKLHQFGEFTSERATLERESHTWAAKMLIDRQQEMNIDDQLAQKDFLFDDFFLLSS